MLDEAEVFPHLDYCRLCSIPTQRDNTHTHTHTRLIHCGSHPSSPALHSGRIIMDTHSIRSLLPFHSCLCHLFIPFALLPSYCVCVVFALNLRQLHWTSSPICNQAPYPPKLDKRLSRLKTLSVFAVARNPSMLRLKTEISFSAAHRSGDMKRYKDSVHMGSGDKSRLSEHAVFPQLIISSESKSYSFFILMHSSKVQ